MKVYHGSFLEITEIDLSKCEKNKDFGKGFYVTKNIKHAEEWAERIGNRNNTVGVVTEFEFGKYLYHEPTHQICFCTLKSLQLISKPCRKPISAVETIVELIVMYLIEKNEMEEESAVNLLCNSDTFANLADESTGLYQKPWQEIYELLKIELSTNQK